jgi:hypothetical protein
MIVFRLVCRADHGIIDFRRNIRSICTRVGEENILSLVIEENKRLAKGNDRTKIQPTFFLLLAVVFF